MLDILDKILELLENKDFPQLGSLLKDMNPADVAELFEDLPREKMALVFRLLPKELAAALNQSPPADRVFCFPSIFSPALSGIHSKYM